MAILVWQFWPCRGLGGIPCAPMCWSWELVRVVKNDAVLFEITISDILFWSNPYLLLILSTQVRQEFKAFLGFKQNKVSAAVTAIRPKTMTALGKSIKVKPAPSPEEALAKATSEQIVEQPWYALVSVHVIPLSTEFLLLTVTRQTSQHHKSFLQFQGDLAEMNRLIPSTLPEISYCKKPSYSALVQNFFFDFWPKGFEYRIS